MCRRSLCRGYFEQASGARRLLVDGSTRSSRGVVEDGLRVLFAVRVRREVEHERHLAAGRRGTGWVAEVRRGRGVFVDLGLAEEASEVVPGRADAYLGHLGLAVIVGVEVVPVW